MSDFESKLEQPVVGRGTRARATLASLRARYGFQTSEREADEVQIISMGGTEIWLRVDGRGPKSIFEMYEVTK